MAVNWSNPWGLGLIFATILVMAFFYSKPPGGKNPTASSVAGIRRLPLSHKPTAHFPFVLLGVMVDQRPNNNPMSVFH